MSEPETIDLSDAERIARAEDELREWRRVGGHLWPYVANFGLCGASQDAIAGMIDLARLLGIEQAAVIDTDEVVEISRENAIEEACQFIQSRPYILGIPKRFRERLFSDLQTLKHEGAEGCE